MTAAMNSATSSSIRVKPRLLNGCRSEAAAAGVVAAQAAAEVIPSTQPRIAASQATGGRGRRRGWRADGRVGRGLAGAERAGRTGLLLIGRGGTALPAQASLRPRLGARRALRGAVRGAGWALLHAAVAPG